MANNRRRQHCTSGQMGPSGSGVDRAISTAATAASTRPSIRRGFF